MATPARSVLMEVGMNQTKKVRLGRDDSVSKRNRSDMANVVHGENVHEKKILGQEGTPRLEVLLVCKHLNMCSRLWPHAEKTL